MHRLGFSLRLPAALLGSAALVLVASASPVSAAAGGYTSTVARPGSERPEAQRLPAKDCIASSGETRTRGT